MIRTIYLIKNRLTGIRKIRVRLLYSALICGLYLSNIVDLMAQSANEIQTMIFTIEQAIPDRQVFAVQAKSSSSNCTNNCTLTQIVDQNTILLNSQGNTIALDTLKMGQQYTIEWFRGDNLQQQRLKAIKLQ